MKPIIKVTTLGASTTKGARLMVVIGTQRYYYNQTVEAIELDQQRVNAAREAMLERGYAKGGVFVAGFDDGERDTITYTRLPLEVISERAARSMFRDQPAIENRDWFYY